MEVYCLAQIKKPLRSMLSEETLDKLLSCLKVDQEQLSKYIWKLIEARDKITKFKCSDPNFYYGSLVFDIKNYEIGFIVGPIDIYKSSISEDNQVYLVVTLPKLEENSDSGTNFRVRYTKKSLLKPIELEQPRRPADDLSEFCNKQCIMDCSEDCALWKYRKK